MTGKINTSRLVAVAAQAMSGKGPLADLASDWEHDQREAVLLCAAEDAIRAILSEIKKIGYRIVPIEMTGEMKEAWLEGHMPFGDFEHAWAMACFAAPKTEQ